MEGQKLNEGAVTALSGNDFLVGASASGALTPVSVASFLAQIQRELKAGGLNMLKGANQAVRKTDVRAVGNYLYDGELPKEGDVLTLTACVSCSGGSGVLASPYGSNIYQGITLEGSGNCDHAVFTKTFTVVAGVHLGNYLMFYRVGETDRTPATIHWAVLQRGACLGVNGWLPSESEIAKSGGVIYYLSDLQKGGSRDGKHGIRFAAVDHSDDQLSAAISVAVWGGRAYEIQRQADSAGAYDQCTESGRCARKLYNNRCRSGRKAAWGRLIGRSNPESCVSLNTAASDILLLGIYSEAMRPHVRRNGMEPMVSGAAWLPSYLVAVKRRKEVMV